jgi:hypothetical protein
MMHSTIRQDQSQSPLRPVGVVNEYCKSVVTSVIVLSPSSCERKSKAASKLPNSIQHLGFCPMYLYPRDAEHKGRKMADKDKDRSEQSGGGRSGGQGGGREAGGRGNEGGESNSRSGGNQGGRESSKSGGKKK